MQQVDKWKVFEQIGYKPHSEGQFNFHNSTARYRIVAAGTRWGKSKAAGIDTVPMLLLPNKQVWIIGPTYQLGEKEFRYIWEAMIVQLKLGPYCKRKNNNVELGDMYIEFPWNSWIRVKSAEKPSNLLGEELDRVILAEGSQIKERVWTRYVRGRLVSRMGDMICNCTPNEQDLLVYPMFLKGQDRGRYPEYESWNFKTEENPEIERSEIEDAKRTLPEDEFREQFLGEFIILGAKSWFLKDRLYKLLECSPSHSLYEVRTHCEGDILSSKFDYEMVESDGGQLRIYDHPNKNYHYTIGCDVSDDETELGDYSVIEVYCVDTGKQAAIWHGIINPGELADVCAAIGMYYGSVPIGIEYNTMGAVTNDRIKKIYKGPLYRREVYDTKNKKPEKRKKIGWYTSAKTKPIMINELKSALDTHRYIPQDPDTIRELLAFGKDKKSGKLKGLGSSHDDRVIAAAIALMVAKQFPETSITDGDIREHLDSYEDFHSRNYAKENEQCNYEDEDISNLLRRY